MPNPQKENGYTGISNELLDAIISAKFSSRSDLPLKLVFCVIRKTYGFQKKIDRISLSQFEKMTGAGRANCNYWLKRLVSLQVLVSLAKPEGRYYGLNKDYSKWLVSLPLLVALETNTSIASSTRTSIASSTHKRKKEITKEIPLTPQNSRQHRTNPRALGTNPRNRNGGAAPEPPRGKNKISKKQELESNPIFQALVDFMELQEDTTDAYARAHYHFESYGEEATREALGDPAVDSVSKFREFADAYLDLDTEPTFE